MAYSSQELKGKNLHLATYENEQFALVMVVKKLKAYLLGLRFKICTNQQGPQEFS